MTYSYKKNIALNVPLPSKCEQSTCFCDQRHGVCICNSMKDNIPGSTSPEEMLSQKSPHSISRSHHRHRCRHASLQ